jgi:hypothetical protein
MQSNDNTESKTNCTDHIPSSEADSRSVAQDIQYLLWNLKIHYRVRKGTPSVRILMMKLPQDRAS